MKTVCVSASRRYPVHIGYGLLEQAGPLLKSVKEAGTAAVISDSNVWPLHGKTLVDSLENAGYHVISFVFPAGEASKSSDTYLKILSFLAEHHLTRSDILLALGGGVTGDLVGFAAATYLRGISYVQLPTSLLAMVDSSVGGKTAIDLPSGKNLVGAFYQPELVLCDLQTLQTLPDHIFRDGCAEVIKYGVLYDPALFAHLTGKGLDFDRETVVARCVELKSQVVAQDEFDTGVRQMLNLGHTIGHSVETCSHFEISHGQAVAIGMALITKAGVQLGITSNTAKQAIMEVLKRFGLPVATAFSAEQLYQAALSDKKRNGQKITLIFPVEIGSCRIYPTELPEFRKIVEAGTV